MTLVTVPPPQAVLAATIIVNLKGMLKQFSDTCSLWKTNRVDLVRGLGAQGCDRGFQLMAPLDLLTTALLFLAHLAGDLCGHHPAESGPGPGSGGGLLPAACGGPHPAVSHPSWSLYCSW